MKRVLILAGLLLASGANAQQQDPWSGKATLGFLSTSGNTENSTLNSAFEVGYTTGDWYHEAKAVAVNATEDSNTTAEAYELGWKSEWSIAENQFLFGRLQWRKDRFSGFDTQFSQSVGYGRRLIDNEKHKLNVEGGAGARQSDLADGTTEEEFILRLGSDYSWQLSETSKFEQALSIEAGDENTYVESVTSLSASLVGNLALVFSYTVKNNSDVPADRENTDTFTAISLEYQF
ncbi:MAG: DUF481 domain-containing protein [Pseudomonadota bacterium]